MDLATLGIRIDVSGAIAATKQLASALGKLSTEGTKSTNSLTSAIGGLTKFVGAGYLAHAFVANTVEAQNALAQLEAAVKSTGGTANRTVAELDAYSSALERTSTFSDEAIKGAQAMLLTFNKIEGVNFDAATSAIVDLASRMGTDLQGAAVQVGKALQDPATGLVALRRSGVSFSESQIEVIKKLQDTGHAAEAQRLILAELEKEFGGSAEAARNTLGGALESLKNQFGNVFEMSRTSTGGIVDAINALGAAMPAVRETINAFFGGLELAALDARIAVENLVDGITKTPWGALKAMIGGAIGNSALVAEGGLDMASNPEMAELIAARDKIREQLAAQVIGTDAATAANKRHAKSIDDVNKPSKEWLALQKEIAHIRTEAIVAADAAQAKRLAGVRSLQDEEDQQTALLAALTISTEAYQAQVEAQEIANAVRAAGITIADAEYDEAVRSAKASQDAAKAIKERQKATEDLAKAEKDLQEIVAKGVETLNRVAKEGTANQAAEQQKYMDDMRAIWREGAGAIASGFVKSMRKGFEEVYELSIKLMKRMEDAGAASGFGYGALKLGAAGVGGGLAGYAVGQATGNKVTGALGGAASGALAGSAFGPAGAAVGALAGFVGGILGAGNAAKEAAKAMLALQSSLALNIASIKATIAGDELGQSIAKVRADFEALRKQTEDAYAGGSSGSEQVRKRNEVLAELNALEVTRIAQLAAEADLKKKQTTEDVRVQTLRNNGLAEQADAMAQALADERQLAELRKQGIDEATLAALKESTVKRDADAAALLAANELKAAADAAAASAAAARAQSQALEDLNVELLAAKGDAQGASDLEFQLAQQRRLEDAQKDQSAEYVAKLQELQQIQRDQRAAQQLIDATGGTPSGAFGGVTQSTAATSATSAVSATVTERTAYALVDIGRQQLSALLQVVDLLSAMASGGGGSFGGVNAYLGAGTLASGRYAGSVTRS